MSDGSGSARQWRIRVDEAAAGTRLDAYLAGLIEEISRNRIKDLILAGEVEIDGQKILEPKLKVKPGSEILLNLPPPIDPTHQTEDIPLDILFEDDSLIVINKPVGLVVHPAPGAADGTLVNALIHHCGDSLSGIGGVRRPGIVHRLDKDTSGVMVAAKTEVAHNHLAAQFADHGRTGPLRRAYLAFVWGHHQSFSGTIDAPLGRDSGNRLKQAVRKDGREAITHYRSLSRYAGDGWDVSKLECRLETGRTHQIRVHMTYAGHPILGDPLYATGFMTKSNRLPEPLRSSVSGLTRQALHAAELGFEHPVSGKQVMFTAPLPADLMQLDAHLARFDTSSSKSLHSS